ncbi:MAG: glycosyltransferase family 2 protein [Methylomonas sp.]|nr:glycosyltransferase family 2 protein [Methylomonas sp.]
MPDISFIIPLFNHLKETRAMLHSLLGSLPKDLDYEILLVDDFSTDGTRDWLATLKHSRVRVILNAVNLGYAKSNNLAAQQAHGSLIGLLNNDLLFESGWLEPMRMILEHPALRAGIVGNVQYRVADGGLDHAGIDLNCKGRFEHIQTLDEGGSNYQRVLAVTGACLLMHKADFLRFSGFGEGYFNGGEDVDLCFKMREAGKRIYVATASRIRHHVSLSRGDNTLQNERNSRRLFTLWRDQIKQALVNQWLNALRKGEDTYRQWIDGEFTESFLRTPQTVAWMMAETMIVRQERYWSKHLDDMQSDSNVPFKYSVSGLRFEAESQAHRFKKSFCVVIEGLNCIDNFFVCGRIANGYSPGEWGLSISVNGLQRKTMSLDNRHVNAGIADPVILPNIANKFEIEVEYLGRMNNSVRESGQDVLLVSHLVVDGCLASL